jgi:hypothetical protein
LLVLGERKIFLQITEIVKIARRANEIMTRVLQQSRLEFEPLIAENQRMRLLEKESDEIAFEIKGYITNGAVNPTILDNLLACVDVADSVVDDYYYLAREITRIARVEPSENRISPLNSALLTMLNLADRSFATVEELLAEKDISEVMGRRQVIERYEEEGDEIKDDAFDELYALAPKMRYIDFIHYSELLHKIDDILDACEDLSDMIVTVITSISK